MSRLFVALLPPQKALDEIDAAVGRLRDEWPLLRWVDPELWHVTLAFLGDVPDAVLPDLRVRLARAAARYRPLDLSFTGAGAFPSPDRGRVFWVGLTAGPSLTRLAGEVAAGALRAGAQVDRKPFHPHLTLARARHGGDLRPLVDALRAFRGLRWRAEAVHLVQSHLGARVRYETVDSYPLRDDG